MINLADTIHKSFQQIEEMLGNNSFTWEGQSYACTPSGTGSGKSLELGGILDEGDLTLVVRKSIFPNGVYPEPKQLILYKGDFYRIDSIKINSTDTFIRIVCKFPNG